MSQEVLELKAKLYDMGVELQRANQSIEILNGMGTSIANALGVMQDNDGQSTYSPEAVVGEVEKLVARVHELEDEKDQAHYDAIEQSERDSLEK